MWSYEDSWCSVDGLLVRCYTQTEDPCYPTEIITPKFGKLNQTR